MSRRVIQYVVCRIAALVVLLLVGTPAAAWADCPSLGTEAISIAIDNPGVPLTDYFALVTIDTATPIAAGHMRADGGDIRVGDAACTPYAYWLESGINTSATRI
jgi:hypothetical protein